MNTEVEITEGRIAEEPKEVTQAGQTGQNRLFKWIAAGFPPGAHILTEILCSAVLLALLISGSMRFYQRMDNWKAISREMQAEYDRLVEEAGGGVIDIYWDPRAFQDLDYFIEGCFVIYPLLIAWCIFLVIMNYVCFYRGSKSIYVMKRLKSKAELHRRCLLLPVISALIGTVYVWVMIRNFIHIYNDAEIFKTGVDTVSLFRVFLFSGR